MSSDTVPQILLILLFVFLSGFFSLLKSSYENMNLFKLEKMIEAEEIDEKDSLLMKRIIQNPQKVQNSLMIADYLSNALVATLSARIGYRIYGEIGMLIALLIAVILILVIGENTPYSISLIKGDKAAIKFVGLTKTITRVLFPIQTLVKFFLLNLNTTGTKSWSAIQVQFTSAGDGCRGRQLYYDMLLPPTQAARTGCFFTLV